MARTYDSPAAQALYDDLMTLHKLYLKTRLELMSLADAMDVDPSIVRAIARQVLIDATQPENRARVAQMMVDFDLAEPRECS